MKQLYQPASQPASQLRCLVLVLLLFVSGIAFSQVEYEEPCGFVNEDINLHKSTSSPCVSSAPYSGSISLFSTYPAGTYVVALTCNGVIVATKNLVIQ